MFKVSTVTQAQTIAENLQEKIRSRSARVGIVGPGYVGLPLAVEFARAGYEVTGIDVSQTRPIG
jgi:UDP-N-acetyl-D-glucosamine dehydrogenase